MSLISVNLAQGQVDALGTTFVSIGGGLNTYANDHLGLMDTRGKAFEGTLGTWVSGSVGMRGQLSLQYATNLDTAQSAYYYGYFDLFWSPVSSFCGFTPNRPFDLRLLYGIGLVHAVAHSDIFFDMRYGYTPSRFMHLTIPQGRFSVGMVTVSMGYVYNFGDSRCRRVSVSR